MSNFRLGRKPNDPSKPRLRLSKFLKTIEAAPENRDWLSGVNNWPMYLNDQIGDCTCATVGHIIQATSTYGQGQTVTITDKDVLKAYIANSGYDPRTGANDNGAIVQDVLNYWRKEGVGSHKILAFGELNHEDFDEIRNALNVFGTVYLGIDFPNTAMDQFENNEPWDVVHGAYSEGGHAINAGYYDVSDGMWKVVTWGKVQPMTQAFFDKYVDEAWAVITPEWFDANGNSPLGHKLYDLGQDLQELTGEPNPFPAPEPAPTPDPVVTPPVPVEPPVVDDWRDELRKELKHIIKEIRDLLKQIGG